MKRFSRCRAPALLLGVALIGTQAGAQTYPAKPVRVIVGFGAGGPLDSSARLIAEQLAPRLGQPVIVENRTGAAGAIASEYVAAQSPDGYTLMFTGSNFAAYPAFYKTWKLDLMNSFSYAGTSSDSYVVLAASTALPARNLQELMAWGKANPGKLNWGEAGSGAWDFILLSLDRDYAWNMTRISYKTTGDAKVAALRGDVHLYFDGLNSSIAEIKDGRVRGIGLIGTRRSSAMPDLPTLSEAGLSGLGFAPDIWNGYVGPANIPADVLARFSRALKEAVESPEYAGRVKLVGNDPHWRSPAEMRAMVAKDSADLIAMAKKFGVAPQ
jgi:tripartite-type tricarboxylate transporter receptor subunit TctC